jgi:hypothetical protein
MQIISSNPAPFRAPVPTGICSVPVLERNSSERERGETSFPPVPTLLATRLQLELLLCDRSVDLRAAAGIILNDLGATLEIFRRAGEECGTDSNTGGAAIRLEDCLASLGTETWMDAVCANAVERAAGSSNKLLELTAFWEHARSLAYACWLLAEGTEGICPNEAYLVGLLHEAGKLPELLDWELPTAFGAESCWTAQSIAHLATYWQLPQYLQAVIATITSPSSSPSRWSTLLRTAHAWSRGEESFLSPTAELSFHLTSSGIFRSDLAYRP